MQLSGPAAAADAHHAHAHRHTHHHHDAGCSCGHEPPPDPAALVSLRGASLRRDGRDLILGVDLDVHPGEIVTLIGPNGAGKSTLVKIVLGILKPDSGSLLTASGLRIGYVPQKFEVDRAIPMTVSGFLALGTDAKADAIAAALAESGASRLAGQQLAALSGGEIQRVLIARALLRVPNLLVLDEPASGVDYAGEAELYEMISRLRDKRNLGVLLVSHDLHVVMAKSDRVVCLNGHVCCSGRPEAVAQSSAYARLFGPDAARTLAVYHHHHDHRHDLSGATLPIADEDEGQPR